MHQSDIGMDCGGHHLVGDFGIALRDMDRMFFMQAEQHFRAFVTQIIDDGIMQAAIARAGIERDIGQIERAQRLGDDVAAKVGLGGERPHGLLGAGIVTNSAIIPSALRTHHSSQNVA